MNWPTLPAPAMATFTSLLLAAGEHGFEVVGGVGPGHEVEDVAFLTNELRRGQPGAAAAAEAHEPEALAAVELGQLLPGPCLREGPLDQAQGPAPVDPVRAGVLGEQPAQHLVG